MKSLVRTAIAAVLVAVGFVNAQASTLTLPNDGTWLAFDVSDLLAQSGGNEWIDIGDGSPLSFTFIIAAGKVGELEVVDTGYAGDTFKVYNGVTQIGVTSPVPVGIYLGVPGISDPDVALANVLFSRGRFVLGPGAYNINGVLDQSVLFDATGGGPLNSTSGGIQLTVSEVPEPGTAAMLLAGLGLLGVCVRRRGTRVRATTTPQS